MSFRESYIQEFDHEAVSTRKALERIPAEKFDWAPHAKSTKLGSLANHIVSLPYRSTIVLGVDEFDAKTPASSAARPATTSQELVDQWDKHMEQMRAAVAAISDEKLAGTFTMKLGAETIFQPAAEDRAAHFYSEPSDPSSRAIVGVSAAIGYLRAVDLWTVRGREINCTRVTVYLRKAVILNKVKNPENVRLYSIASILWILRVA